jgi:hypothetical protein
MKFLEVPLAGAYSNPHVQEQITHLYSLACQEESDDTRASGKDS